MKLYLSYLIIRPLGVSPEDEKYDRKADFVLAEITANKEKADILVGCRHLDAKGRISGFVVMIDEDGQGNDLEWTPPQNMSISDDKLYIGGMFGGDWHNVELTHDEEGFYIIPKD